MPTLGAREVHIWTARLDCCAVSHLGATLSEAERVRASRYQFEKDRRVYVFAHNVLRDVLSRYLNQAAADIRFREDSFGKPFLDPESGHERLTFNMSHGGALVLIAVSSDRRLGVDVEEIRPVDGFHAIAKTHFTPQECGFIFGHIPQDQEGAFLRCWTRKEAYVKAVGKGLSIPLNSFDTYVQEGRPGRTLAGVPGTGANWWLTDLDLPKRYVGALAAEDGIERIVYFEWIA